MKKTAISRYLTLVQVAGARRVAGEGRVHADLQGTTTWPLHNGKNRWTESHSGWAWTRHALPAGYERTSSWHLCRDGEEGLVQKPSRSAKCFKDCSLQCGCWSDWWPCWFPCLPRQDPSTDLFISRDSSWTPTPARVHGQGLHLPVQGRWCTWSLARGLSLSTPHQHWQCCSASNLHQGHRDVGSRKACLAEQLVGCLPVRICGGCRDQPLRCYCNKVNWTLEQIFGNRLGWLDIDIGCISKSVDCWCSGFTTNRDPIQAIIVTLTVSWRWIASAITWEHFSIYGRKFYWRFYKTWTYFWSEKWCHRHFKVAQKEGSLAFFKGLTAQVTLKSIARGQFTNYISLKNLLQYLRIGPHSLLQLVFWHHGRQALGLTRNKS